MRIENVHASYAWALFVKDPSGTNTVLNTALVSARNTQIYTLWYTVQKLWYYTFAISNLYKVYSLQIRLHGFNYGTPLKKILIHVTQCWAACRQDQLVSKSISFMHNLSDQQIGKTRRIASLLRHDCIA